jgi:hypothetical protein
MPFEIITTTDKAKRDQMFQDLKQNGNELERQVVKFSGVEPVMNPNDTSEQEHKLIRYSPKGRIQMRPIYRSNFSVAYPTS